MEASDQASVTQATRLSAKFTAGRNDSEDLMPSLPVRMANQPVRTHDEHEDLILRSLGYIDDDEDFMP